MQLKFSSQYSWQICIISIIVLSSLHRSAKSENNGILTFEFICYENPDHLDKLGKKCDSFPSVKCDTYFTICIGNQAIVGDIKKEKCGMYYQETNPYDNHDLICKTPTDNRGALRHTITIETEFSYSKVIYVKINAHDNDQWTSIPTLIASFSTELTTQFSLSSQKVTYPDFKFSRSDFRYSNPKVNMKIQMGLQCKSNRYGPFCLTFCQATKAFTCSEVGEKICKEGWKGKDCQFKDHCLYKLCAQNATCKETANGTECICDGQTGPECYPDFNPCTLNPCQNEGLCIPNQIKRNLTRCSCYFPFIGSKCQHEICTFEPCHNNATCFYDENNTRNCNCTPGYNGKLCDQKIYDRSVEENSEKSIAKEPNSNFLLILTVSFGTLFVIFGLAVIFLINKRKQKQINDKKYTVETIKMSNLDIPTKNNSETDAVYSQSSPFERDYETIDDLRTYAYVDDYLVPSTLKSPVSPPIDNPDYLILSCNSDIFETVNENVSQETTELPELPSREFKRKLSLKSFCLP